MLHCSRRLHNFIINTLKRTKQPQQWLKKRTWTDNPAKQKCSQPEKQFKQKKIHTRPTVHNTELQKTKWKAANTKRTKSDLQPKQKNTKKHQHSNKTKLLQNPQPNSAFPYYKNRSHDHTYNKHGEILLSKNDIFFLF